MKKFSITTVLVFICTISFSQLWSVENSKLRVCHWSFGASRIATAEYTNSGDTLINGIIYENIKVVDKYYDFFTPNTPNYNYYSLPLVRREDTLFFHNRMTNSEGPLFVFNLSPNQSFQMGSNIAVDSCLLLDLAITVDSSYTFQFQGTSYTRYFTSQIQDASKKSMMFRYDLNSQYPMDLEFNYSNQNKFVGMFDDLIGTCDYGLLEWPFTCIADEGPMVLDYQYYQNGDSLRVNSNYCENDLSSSTSIESFDLILAYPNPCNNYLYLKSKDKNIDLFDNYGQKVKLDLNEQINQSLIINTSQLKSGIYFLVNNTGKNQKLIIQH